MSRPPTFSQPSQSRLFLPAKDAPKVQHPLFDPSPQQLRELVLGYLTHHCYVETVRAFAGVRGEPKGKAREDASVGGGGDVEMRDERVADDAPLTNGHGTNGAGTKHAGSTNGNGVGASQDEEIKDDELALEVDGNGDERVELSQADLRDILARKEIITNITSGQIPAAVTLLNAHFPTVLNPSSGGKSSRPTPPTRKSSRRTNPSVHAFPHSAEPAHISLNLQIQAWIESVRSTPLPAGGAGAPEDPPSPATSSTGSTTSLSTSQVNAMLMSLQALYAAANQLPVADRPVYLKELDSVSALMAYTTPETSPVKVYLSQERRDGLATQVNNAIMLQTNHPPIPVLESLVRQTSFVFAVLHENQVPVPEVPPSFLLERLGEQGYASYGKEVTTHGGKKTIQVMPKWDLREFLDEK